METEKRSPPLSRRKLGRLPEATTRSGYLWCLICERAYARNELSRDEIQLCPYDGCKGRSVFYSWDWNRTRKVNPGHPQEPRLGLVYPLFGRGDDLRSAR